METTIATAGNCRYLNSKPDLFPAILNPQFRQEYHFFTKMHDWNQSYELLITLPILKEHCGRNEATQFRFEFLIYVDLHYVTLPEN